MLPMCLICTVYFENENTQKVSQGKSDGFQDHVNNTGTSSCAVSKITFEVVKYCRDVLCD